MGKYIARCSLSMGVIERENGGGMMKERQGLVMVHTGNGKGKTTAALGLAFRAWGQGLRILVLQFIKGNWKYGELKTAEALAPRLIIRPLGEGFVQRTQEQREEKEAHQAAAAEALKEANDALTSGEWDMVILDEINYAVHFGLVSVEQVLDLVEAKPPTVHLVLTGRNAREELIEKADLVTEMREIKHPYQKGIKAQQGIEF